MLTEYAPSLGLTKGLRVQVYESVAELEKDAGAVGKALALANKYLREKVALVEGRDVIVTELEKASGFKMKKDTIEKKDAEGKVSKIEVAAWTEVEYLRNFRKACMAGAVPNWPKDEAGIEAQLQNFADQFGPFKADASKPERVGKAKTPPDYAFKGADAILANNSQDKWIKTFTKEAVAFEDFRTPDAALNRVRLAWAIKAREDMRSKKEYA